MEENDCGLARSSEPGEFAESRRKLAADRLRPLYHFTAPVGTLNDPNGLCHWRGRWHLFYQTVPPGKRLHWGHAVSDNLIRWRDLPYAIRPNPETDCFSGAVFVEEDRAVAAYHGTNAGTMVAVANDDLLCEWHKVNNAPVIQCHVMWQEDITAQHLPGWRGNAIPRHSLNLVYDPCIWRKGNHYYILNGGALLHQPSGRRMRTPFLFRSADLASWEYLHPFTEGDIFGLPGDDFGCPYFWPIGNRHILLHYSHMRGAQYIIGDYDTARDKFVATQGGSFTFGASHSGNLHAPSAFPDGRGGLVAIFNINSAKPTPGWDQVMSLPRRLTLIGNDELGQEPAGDWKSLRRDLRQIDNLELPANREIVASDISSNAMEIEAEIALQGAQMVELLVLRAPGREEFTRIAFYPRRGAADWLRSNGWERWAESRDGILVIDTSYSSTLPDAVSRAPECAPLFLASGETLKLRVFIDRSVIEVFANGRQCLALRVYPGRADSAGVALRAQGSAATLLALKAWQMGRA